MNFIVRFVIIKLLFFLTTAHFEAQACRCFPYPIKEQVSESDLIFTGTVKSHSVGKQSESYTFQTTKTWKGTNNDINIISTGGTFCSARFVNGQEYVVFASRGATSSCRSNVLLSECYFMVIVAYFTDQSFKDKVGIDTNSYMTDLEAYYFNSIFNPIINNVFDFHDKKIAFINERNLTNKKFYFDTQGGEVSADWLILLNETEKRSLRSYDAVIVSSSKTTRHSSTIRRKRALKIVRRGGKQYGCLIKGIDQEVYVKSSHHNQNKIRTIKSTSTTTQILRA